MRDFHWFLVALGVVTLALYGCDRGLGPDVAARAGDFQLDIEEIAQILAPVSELPNDVGVAEAALEFWIDYTLLAWVVNDEGALEDLEVSSIVNQEISRQLVLQLREQVIEVDTTITDEQLRAAFYEDRPGEEIRARHILLALTADAPPQQRDSVRALAAEIRERAAAGEDFAGLAREYSDDSGSAIQGGDLGFFGRGAMVPPFEEAAFALAPGEVSDVVESPFGLHVIVADERRGPTLEDIADDYRVQLQEEREMVAESMYLAEIEAPANIQIGEDAIALVRRITASPEDRLSGSEGSRLLATWETGELPAEEYREFVLGQPPEIRQQISVAQDAQLESMVHDLTRDRILLQEVEKAGIESTEEQTETITADVLAQYVLLADYLGVDSLEVEEGSNLVERVGRESVLLMGRLVSNQLDIIPLGPLALPLRARYEPRVGEEAAEGIVARIAELRSGGSGALDLSQPPARAPTATPPEPAPSPEAVP